MNRRGSSIRTSAVFAFLAVTLAVSGCASTVEDTSTPSRTRSASATPSPSSPTPSASPSVSPSPSSTVDAADPGTWVISADGIGPLKLGAALDATAASLPEGWTQDQQRCPWAASWNAPDYTVWVVTSSDAGPVDMVASTSRGNATADAVGPRTAEGVGVGTPVATAKSAYPDAQQGTTAIGGNLFLRVENTFMEYRDENAAIEAVWVTDGEEPPYEICG